MKLNFAHHTLCALFEFLLWTWIRNLFFFSSLPSPPSALSSFFPALLFFVSKSIINDSTIFMTMKNAMNREQCLRMLAKVFILFFGCCCWDTQSPLIAGIIIPIWLSFFYSLHCQSYTLFMITLMQYFRTVFVLWISRLESSI